MPFKSQAQWKRFFAMEQRGKLPKGTAERWAKKTKIPFRQLPKRLAKRTKITYREIKSRRR